MTLVSAVRLYSQDFVYQASYKSSSVDPHLVVEELQPGFVWEHTQFVVNLQTFFSLKQPRAHSGMSVRSTCGFPGHCVSYQSSVRFQQSQSGISCLRKGEGSKSKRGNHGDCGREIAKTHFQAHSRGFGFPQKQSVITPIPQPSIARNSLFNFVRSSSASLKAQ